MLGLGLGLTAVRRPPAGTILLGPNFLSPLLTFARASGATVTDAAGNIVVYGNDVPRYGYDAGIGGWLLEGGSTNLLLGSAALASQSVAVTAQPYVLSFRGTGSVALSGAYTGTLNGTGATNRVRLPFTSSADTLMLTVTGQVLSAQLEAGTVATSYIPTTDTPATRARDNLSVVGPQFAALFGTGAPQGCAVLEMRPLNVGQSSSLILLSLSDGTNNNRITLYLDSSGRPQVSVTIGGATATSPLVTPALVSGAVARVGVRWGGGSISVRRDGGTLQTLASATPPNLNQMLFCRLNSGGVGAAGLIPLAAALPYAPPNAEFQALCTPGVLL